MDSSSTHRASAVPFYLRNAANVSKLVLGGLEKANYLPNGDWSFKFQREVEWEGLVLHVSTRDGDS